MILVAGLSPAWQQVMSFDQMRLGEVNRAREVTWTSSGKVLNVALALHHLQAAVKVVAPVGGAAGDAIRREFAELSLPAQWIPTAAPTRTCTTLLDRTTGCTTELVENAAALKPAEIDAFVREFAALAKQAQVVILTGSLPSGAPAELFRQLLQPLDGIPAILDLRGAELWAALQCRPLLVKPNREELAKTVGYPLDSEIELRAALTQLHARGAQWVVVTQGAQGAWISGPTGIAHATAPRVEVVNPIGCGDCLAAGIAWGVAQGFDPMAALPWGMAAAAQNAQQLLPARLNAASVRQLAAQIPLQPID